MNQSLKQFFKNAPVATLNTCDREPIHHSGMIQNIGAMIVVDPDTLQIVGASENTDFLIARPVDALLGQPLQAVKPGVAAQIQSSLGPYGLANEVLDTVTGINGTSYDVITHVHAGHRFIEWVPNIAPLPSVARRHMRISSKACSAILNADNFEAALQIAVDAVRRIICFSRVKIYQFLPDNTGAVIAESRDHVLPSYLGLHFPAEDIPSQTRESMRIVPYRMIGTTSDNTLSIHAMASEKPKLDLTWSVTRSVSPMHTQYLRNMNVGASFSCALKSEEQLWGLIACHNDEELCVPADSWRLVQEVGTTLMLRHDRQVRSSTADVITNLRRIESQFESDLRRSGDVEKVIGTLMPVLQKFLRADGFAFQFGNKIHTSGRTPPEDFIRKLAHWAQENMADGNQFQTIELHRLFPDARDHFETACGVLVQPIIVHRVCQFLWFRGPITRRVEWAGTPHLKKDDEDRLLTPRKSFEKWINEHRDQSLHWEKAELASAREIFKEFLGIIASQVLLKEENSSLYEFTHIATHDKEAPLRGTGMALEWTTEDQFELESSKQGHDLVCASTKRLQALTESLLELSLLNQQDHEFDSVDLAQPVRETVPPLACDAKETKARVSISELPCCEAALDLMTRLLTNLIGNAIKIRNPDCIPDIHIECQSHSGEWAIVTVTDNGPGIATEYAERVFMPTKRLVSQDEVGGSGLGLTICRQIVEIHGGSIRVDTSHSDGARFVIELPMRT